MRLSLTNMKNRANVLSERIKEKERALKTAPEGILRIDICRGKPQYYQKMASSETKGKYLKAGNEDLARQLAQKDYDKRVLANSIDELKTLNILIRKYEKGIGEDIYGKLPFQRQALVSPVALSNEEFVRRWLAEPYTGLGFEPGSPELYNTSGIRVRSKSEIIISDKYDELFIPYRYECPVYLEGFGWVYPDFTLLNVKLRKIFYHEHCGMMDDTAYADDTVGKIQAYERNGIIPGKNLILTFETKDHPILPRDIGILAEHYLL